MESESTQQIVISPKAATEINKIREANQIPNSHALRIGVKEGGCCGVSYFLAFDEESNENDIVFNSEGITLFVDELSLSHLKGATLEFVTSPQGSGFRFDNPNIEKSCNCDDACCG